jgi:hypothetical protein
MWILISFQQLLSDVVHFQLSEFQKRWRLFWRTNDGSQTNGMEPNDFDAVLPK